MIRTAVARRYAKALFEVGLDRGVLESTQNGLDSLAMAIKNVPLVVLCLDNVEIPFERRRALVESLCEQLGVAELIRDFLILLVSSCRVSVISDVAVIHRELMAVAMNVTQATATVADPAVVDDVQRLVVHELEKKLGRPARCVVNVEPELIGGVMVKVGDQTLDASVSGRIERLREELLRE